jgi:hypothetical protein
MNNKKNFSNQVPQNYSTENLTDMPSSSEPSTSDIEKLKDLYLPNSKADNHPSEKSIEDANDLEHPKPPSPNSLT